MLKDLHVTGLEVENFMRVRVARLQPGPGLIEVAGPNRNGKTSLLQAIEAALGGKDSIPWTPIRTGEETALIRVDLGNSKGLQLRVTRRFIAKDDRDPPYTTTLKVELPDGSRPKGEQTLLTSLLQGIAFDPQAFMDAKPSDRADILRGLVTDFDFDANAKRRAEAFDDRANENREVKRLTAYVESIKVPLDTPAEMISTAPLMARLSELGAAARAYEEAKAVRRQAWEALDREQQEITDLTYEAAKLRERADRMDKEAAERSGAWGLARTRFDQEPALSRPESAEEISNQVIEADAINARVRILIGKRESEALILERQRKAQSLTDLISRLDREAVDAVARANLPAGLAIRDGRVMLRGVPFEQGSTAEQLRTSMAVGMQMNPDLKVIRIRQGSALDDEAWEIISEAALSEGYQVWAETIHAHSPSAIIMSEGEVKS